MTTIILKTNSGKPIAKTAISFPKLLDGNEIEKLANIFESFSKYDNVSIKIKDDEASSEVDTDEKAKATTPEEDENVMLYDILKDSFAIKQATNYIFDRYEYKTKEFKIFIAKALAFYSYKDFYERRNAIDEIRTVSVPDVYPTGEWSEDQQSYGIDILIIQDVSNGNHKINSEKFVVSFFRNKHISVDIASKDGTEKLYEFKIDPINMQILED